MEEGIGGGGSHTESTSAPSGTSRVANGQRHGRYHCSPKPVQSAQCRSCCFPTAVRVPKMAIGCSSTAIIHPPSTVVTLQWPCDQGSIKIAVHWRRGGRPPPPPHGDPPPTKVTIVGKDEIYHWEHLVGPFSVHKLLGPGPPLLSSSAPPPLSSHASLPLCDLTLVSKPSGQ